MVYHEVCIVKVLQREYCEGCIMKGVSQMLYLEDVLQRLYQKSSIMEVVLQMLYCGGCIMKGVSQSVYHEWCITKVVLQRVYRKGCVIKGVL